jgi:PAS domain S-box-containing protein
MLVRGLRFPEAVMDISSLGPNLLRTLIDHLPDSIYVKDLQGRFVLDNATHMRQVGAKSPEEVVGKTVYDFFPIGLASQYDSDDQQVIRNGKSLLDREEPIVDRSGEARWLITSKVALRNGGSEVIGLVGISRDITSQKRAQEERTRFFQLTPDLLCIAGFDGFFKQLNPSWTATFQFSAAEMMAVPFIEFIHPEDRDATTAQAARIAGGAPMAQFENRYRCRDGSYKWLSWSVSPSTEHRLIYGVARDITEARAAEQRLVAANIELARSEAQLRETMDALRNSHEDLIQAQMHLIQAEKMDSVGRLAAGVAHEVKNPLAILLMGVEYLSHHIPPGSDNAPNVVRAMRDAIRRADRIVRGLLDFSGDRQLNMQPHDIRAVIEQSLLLVKHELISGHVHSSLDLPEGLPQLQLDVTKMQQVFVNLFMNAIHAMPGGGTLSISAVASVFPESGAAEVPRVMSARAGDPIVIVKVEDTGHGIPPDKMARVFDPFFTTKPVGKGTGLGMTVTRKIIELHGGTIELRNRPERGLAVTLVLKPAEGAT